MTAAREMPSVLMYRGRRMDDLSRDELIEALHEIYRAYEAACLRAINATDMMMDVIKRRSP